MTSCSQSRYRKDERPLGAAIRARGQVALLLGGPRRTSERHARHPIGKLCTHAHRTSSFSFFTAWW